jgi:hypothetical protein
MEELLIAPCFPLTYLQAIGSLPPLYLRRAITHLAQLVQVSVRTRYRKIGFRGHCYLTSLLEIPHLRSAVVPALTPGNLQVFLPRCFLIVEKRTTTTRSRPHQKPPSPIKEELRVLVHKGTAIPGTPLAELLAKCLSATKDLQSLRVGTLPGGHTRRSQSFQRQECLSYRIWRARHHQK